LTASPPHKPGHVVREIRRLDRLLTEHLEARRTNAFLLVRAAEHGQGEGGGIVPRRIRGPKARQEGTSPMQALELPTATPLIVRENEERSRAFLSNRSNPTDLRGRQTQSRRNLNGRMTQCEAPAYT
jgi:hypothetical protein